MKYNIMKTIKTGFVSFLCLMSAGVFVACSDDEDTTPSHADANLFSPADDDSSPLAQLRREFKEQTGSYLIYNDTLVKEPNGTDLYGNTTYRIETVDMGYSMLGYDYNYVYKFEYFTDFVEQEKAARLIMNKLAGRLGNAMPYSVLLVKSITTYKYVDGVLEVVDEPYYDDDPDPYPQIIMGFRCFAISTSGDEAFDNADYFDNIFTNIVFSKLNRLSTSQMQEFRKPVENVVGQYKDEIEGHDFECKYYGDEVAMSLGILYEWNRNYFCTKWENDLRDYVDVICNMTEDEIAGEYAEYPIVLERFDALRKIIRNLGVQL